MYRAVPVVEMWKLECDFCGGASWLPPPKSEAEFLNAKCLKCGWHPNYHYCGNPNYAEDNILNFQNEQY